MFLTEFVIILFISLKLPLWSHFPKGINHSELFFSVSLIFQCDKGLVTPHAIYQTPKHTPSMNLENIV